MSQLRNSRDDDEDNLSFFKDAVNEKEYKLVYPILTKVIDISRKLYGK